MGLRGWAQRPISEIVVSELLSQTSQASQSVRGTLIGVAPWTLSIALAFGKSPDSETHTGRRGRHPTGGWFTWEVATNFLPREMRTGGVGSARRQPSLVRFVLGQAGHGKTDKSHHMALLFVSLLLDQRRSKVRHLALHFRRGACLSVAPGLPLKQANSKTALESASADVEPGLGGVVRSCVLGAGGL